MNYRAINIASIIIKAIVSDNNSGIDSCLHIEINYSFGACVKPESIRLNVQAELVIDNRNE